MAVFCYETLRIAMKMTCCVNEQADLFRVNKKNLLNNLQNGILYVIMHLTEVPLQEQ